ncbi:hypothetical protein D3C87_1425740 [compost metagenome]
MSGDVDLRHHDDVAGRCIGDDVAHLILGVETAIETWTAGRGVDVLLSRRARVDAPSADLGQLRIASDLQPPGLVVGQVPMEDVELVQGHPIDEALDELGRLIVAGGIQHDAAPAEARGVGNGHGGNGRRPLPRLGGSQLPQADGAIEKPAEVARRDDRAARGHVQAIGVGGAFRGATKDDSAGRGLAFAHRHVQAARALHQVGEIGRRAQGLRVAARGDQDRCVTQNQGALGRSDGGGTRDDRPNRRFGHSGRGHDDRSRGQGRQQGRRQCHS